MITPSCQLMSITLTIESMDAFNALGICGENKSLLDQQENLQFKEKITNN